MATVPVTFTYLTGLAAELFDNVRLAGSWNADGQWSGQWSHVPMQASVAADGSQRFETSVEFQAGEVGKEFRWGVLLDGPGGKDVWGIAGEVDRHDAHDRHRVFTLELDGRHEVCELTLSRRLGAQRAVVPGKQGRTGIRFAVWAPNAQAVEVVFADPAHGYVADDGSGTIGDPIPLQPARDGIWFADPSTTKGLDRFEAFVGRAYMYRVTRSDGSVRYRTDLFSRQQAGRGTVNPEGEAYRGKAADLDGTVSCSLVLDPDTVLDGTDGEEGAVEADDFWADEFHPDRPVPTRVEDLVIYELHVGALAPERADAGDLGDALGLVPHLVELGVNAVELLPISEFRGEADWGYSTSHFAAIEASAGGPDALKRFVRACHRHGIAVLLDVVYNHYHHNAARAQWAFDAPEPERNIWYWYEGRPEDYPTPEGGYIDNISTGWAPRFHEEIVRQLFNSSAASFLVECHVDDFRLDQTTSIHAYAVLHADGSPAERARIFGQKFLRQWTRTMRLIKPGVILTAEDHSDWDAITRPADEGGLGFDATWFAEFYHHLIGDGSHGDQYAKLLRNAGFGDGRPLALGRFADVLYASRFAKIVYNESHDEAGNAEDSARTLVTAVAGAPLVGETRRWAEARARVAAALTVLSAGTPMFFMGEEVGAQKPYRYTDFLENKEDIPAQRAGEGAGLFRFYRDLIGLRLAHGGLRSREIDILDVDDEGRVLAFRRWDESEDFLVLASLQDEPYAEGYGLRGTRLPGGSWAEIFNSDAAHYGGADIGNAGATLETQAGDMRVVLPANGVIVFRKAS